MDANAVHVDGGTEGEGKVGEFTFNLEIILSGFEGNGEGCGAGTGNESGEDGFAQLPEDGIWVDAADEESDEGITDKQHEQDAADDAEGDLKIGLEETDAVDGEVAGGEGEDTDGKISHDPVNHFKNNFLESFKEIEHIGHNFFGMLILRGIKDNACGETEHDGKDDDGEKISLSKGLKRIGKETENNFNKSVSAAGGAGLHGFDLNGKFSGKFVGGGKFRVEKQGDGGAEDGGIEGSEKIPCADTDSHFTESFGRQTCGAVDEGEEDNGNNDHFEHIDKDGTEGGEDCGYLRDKSFTADNAELVNDDSGKTAENKSTQIAVNEGNTEIPVEKFHIFPLLYILPIKNSRNILH